jgi:peptidoglycan/xylan/chitin deacetylase (PgdA/CDA1 family)
VERGAIGRALVAVLLIGLAALLALAAIAQAPIRNGIPPAVAEKAQVILAGRQAPASTTTASPKHEDIVPVRHHVIPPGRPEVTVPILMYHYIRYYNNPSDPVGDDLSVSPDDFRAQMDYLKQNGYHPVDFSDLRGYLHGTQVLPARPVILTFDDGYADFYTTAYPILAQHNFKAVSYVVPGFLGRGGYMTAGQVLELDRNGVQIASHTWSHRDLTTLPPDQLRAELQSSKAYLEQLLAHPVVDFCYPAGRFDPAVVEAVAESGYQTATTTQLGYRHSLADAITWARVRVHGTEALDVYARMLGQEEPAVTTWIDPYPQPVLPLLPQIFPIIYKGSEPGLESRPQSER